MRRESLVDYLTQIQNESQMNEMAPEIPHPFQSGVQMARDSVRQSLAGLTPEQQHQEARGMGFIGLGRAMSRPSQGMLEGMNQSLGAYTDAYLQQRAQQAQLNAQAYLEAVRQQEEERKYLQRVKEAEMEQQYRLAHMASQEKMHGETLAEQRRSHELAHMDRMKMIDTKLSEKQKEMGINGDSIKGLYGIEYIPLSSLSKTEVSEWAKTAQKERNNLDVNKRAIKATNEMDKIFKEYPDISSSFLNLLSGKGETPGYWETFIRQTPFVDKKKLSAIEKIKKLSSEIQFDIIVGLPGQKGTDRMKRIVEDATSSGRNLQESALFVNNFIRERGNHNIKKIKVIEDAQKNRMMPLFSTEEENDEMISAPELSSEPTGDISNLSTEELIRLYQNE